MLDRIRVEAVWQLLRAKRHARRTIGRFSPRAIRRAMGRFQLNSPSIRDIRAVAAFNGVELDQMSSWKHWLEPHIYPDLAVLSCTAAEIDFEPRPECALRRADDRRRTRRAAGRCGHPSRLNRVRRVVRRSTNRIQLDGAYARGRCRRANRRGGPETTVARPETKISGDHPGEQIDTPRSAVSSGSAAAT